MVGFFMPKIEREENTKEREMRKAIENKTSGRPTDQSNIYRL